MRLKLSVKWNMELVVAWLFLTPQINFFLAYFFGYVWHTYRYAIYLFCSGLSWKCVVWTDTKNKTGNVIYMDHYSANC